MQGSYGRVSWGIQGAQGTAAVAYSMPGIVSRFAPRIKGGVEAVESVGDWSPAEISEGMTSFEASLSIDGIEEWLLIEQAFRSGAGLLPWLSFKFGYDKAADEMLYTAIDNKCDSITLKCDAGGKFTADLSFLGGKVTKAASAPAAQTFFGSRLYKWYNLTWDEAFDLYGFEITYKNNLSMDPVIAGSGTTRDPDRVWDFMDEGQISVSGTLRYRLSNIGLDVQDCIITSGDHTLTIAACSDVSPSQAASISITGLKPVDESLDIPARGNIVVEVPFLATDLSISD